MPHSTFWIRETFVNADQNCRFGEGEWMDSGQTSLGSLYRSLRSEYGGCTGKQYIDRADGPPVQVGWVFRKRMKYEDSKDTYIREVWVAVSSTAPQLRVTNITWPWEDAA